MSPTTLLIAISMDFTQSNDDDEDQNEVENFLGGDTCLGDYSIEPNVSRVTKFNTGTASYLCDQLENTNSPQNWGVLEDCFVVFVSCEGGTSNDGLGGIVYFTYHVTYDTTATVEQLSSAVFFTNDLYPTSTYNSSAYLSSLTSAGLVVDDYALAEPSSAFLVVTPPPPPTRPDTYLPIL